jgi:molybdopterin molybdotransferase
LFECMVDASAPAPQPLFMSTTQDARAAMLNEAALWRLEEVPLQRAWGRVLGEALAARQDLPPFHASAMDGYATRRSDLGGAPLQLVGESAAGQGFGRALAAGEAVRIFTGAAVPEGADTVVIQEEATVEGGFVRLHPDNPNKDNIRARGIDLRAGQVVLAHGRLLDPAALGLIAAAGHNVVKAHSAPRVGVLCTGSELVRPGSQPGPDQIFESNSYALVALALVWGGAAHVLETQGDDAAAIADQVGQTLADYDVLVVVGGASVGDHDLAKPALEKLGLKLIFNKIKMRPGKPTWFGRIGDTLVLGLPGNPASAFVCAHIFLKPLLLALSGAAPGAIAPLRAKLAAPVKAEGPREGFLRAKMWVGEDATVWADATLDQDSSLTTVLAAANGCIRRAANALEGQSGDIVEAFLFEGRSL